MRVSRRILIACSLMSLANPTTFAVETQKTGQLLVQAREHMAAGAHDEAIQLLESALESASEEDCRAIVDQLRKSYPVAIHQTRQAGRHDLADHYAQNLKLIDSVAGRPEAAPASNEADVTELPVAPQPATEAPREFAGGIAVPKAGSARDLAEPKSLPEPADVPPIASLTPDRSIVSTPVDLPAPVSPDSNTGSKVRQFDIAEADDAFRARKYADAGNIYQQLLDTGSLPDSRRGHLAYCRAAALVERINKGPAASAEWDAIRQEIETIQQIQPEFWFAEYLSDLVRERMNRSGEALAKSGGEVASAGIMERTANQIRSMNPLRKVSR